MDKLLYKAAYTVARGLFTSKYGYIMQDIYGSVEHAALYAAFIKADAPDRFDPAKVTEGSEEKLRVAYYCQVIRHFFSQDMGKYNTAGLRAPSSHQTGKYLVPRALNIGRVYKAVPLNEKTPGLVGIVDVVDDARAPIEDTELANDVQDIIKKIRSVDLTANQRQTLDLLLAGLTPSEIERTLNLNRGAAYQRVASLIDRLRHALKPIYNEIDLKASFKIITAKPCDGISRRRSRKNYEK